MTYEKARNILWDRLSNAVFLGWANSDNLNEVARTIYEKFKKDYDEELKYVDETLWSEWVWEMNNVGKQPARTMRWVGGCHAMLYDWHRCTVCGTMVKTSDDVRERRSVPVICPVCNKVENYYWEYIDASKYPAIADNQRWYETYSRYVDNWIYVKGRKYSEYKETCKRRGRKCNRIHFYLSAFMVYVRMKITLLGLILDTKLNKKEIMKESKKRCVK